MATDPLDRFAIVLAAGTGGFCLGAMLAPAMANQRIQWETLATGVLAIAAAAWSVRAAMRLDREQERRHNDTQRLTLRGDRASAARAAYLAGDFMDLTYLAEVDKLPADADLQMVANSSVELVQRAREWTEDINGKLKSVLITEARPLFDPPTAVHYETLEALLDEIQRPMHTLDIESLRPESAERMLQLRSNVVTLMEDIRNFLQMFADDLAELGETYS